MSVLGTLLIELDKTGAINLGTFLTTLDDTVAVHREHGDPNDLASAIEAIASYLRESITVTSHRADH